MCTINIKIIYIHLYGKLYTTYASKYIYIRILDIKYLSIKYLYLYIYCNILYMYCNHRYKERSFFISMTVMCM